MKSISFKLTSTAPLLMHSCQAADPRNPFAKQLKAISSKRKKTDEDHEDMSKIEFLAGLYFNEESGYHLPADLLSAAMLASAKQFKLGSAWKQAVMIIDDAALTFKDADKSPDYLFQKGAYVDVRAVKVGTARIMRTRPRINNWSTTVTMLFDAEKINDTEIVQIVSNAGKYIGFCDNRPRYGRFDVEKIN